MTCEERRDVGRRLGRNVRHDPRSRAYLAPQAPRLASVQHRRQCRPFAQGDLASCTGSALAGLLMTEPLHRPGLRLSQDDAVWLYARATREEAVFGTYPEADGGSSALGVLRAARRLGLISAYRHAFGLRQALHALVLRPVMTGIGWYEGFDAPGAGGRVEIAGAVRGGHEVEVVGLDVAERTVRCVNSWGSHWGEGGHFTMSWDTWERLLHEDGDVATVLL